MMPNSIGEFLLGPWGWGDWMWRGTLAGLLVAMPMALLGVFLYLRRMSLLADALAHVALPGIVAAFLVTGRVDGPVVMVGASGAGLVAAGSISWLSRLRGVRADAAVGIVFTAMFALGVIALSMLVRGAHIDTRCVLFGSILGVPNGTLVLLASMGVAVGLLVGLGWRWLVLSTFDPALAKAMGVPVGVIQQGLMALFTMTAIAGLEAVGAVLAVAVAVLPAATAHQLADRMETMVLWAVVHAAVATLVGMYAAIWTNVAPPGAIVLAGGLFYGVARLWRARSTHRGASPT